MGHTHADNSLQVLTCTYCLQLNQRVLVPSECNIHMMTLLLRKYHWNLSHNIHEVYIIMMPGGILNGNPYSQDFTMEFLIQDS